MFIAAFISFFSFWLVISHLPASYRRRMVGYILWVDLFLHGSIILMFIGTSTMGLLQAEAAGICFSLYLRAYRFFCGYETLINGRWYRFKRNRYGAYVPANYQTGEIL